VPQRRIDLTELARRVRRRGLLRALAEGTPPPPRPAAPPLPQPEPAPDTQPTQQLEPVAEPEVDDGVEVIVDSLVTRRLRACTISCSAVIVGLADLPAIESGSTVLEVALLRMRVRRPEGTVECCVRQHVPPELRPVVSPGAGVMVLAHQADPAIAAVDWEATGDWIGADLTFPGTHEQYDWPEPEHWPAVDAIEVRDVDGYDVNMYERRGRWSLASAGLLSLAPLDSRLDHRDLWQVELELPDGSTVEVSERMPLLALARLTVAGGTRVGTPIDVLVSPNGEVAVDWEATLRQPELRAP
jgi:hypothetical protein